MMVLGRSGRTATALVAMMLFAIGVASCGDDSSDESSGAAASGSSTSSSSGGSGAEWVTKAKAELAKFESWPTDIGITEPLEKRPEGKVLDYVACAAPLCVQLGKDVTEAAAKIGIKTNVVNGGTTPETVTAAFNKVVQDKPDAVIDMNFPLEQWQQQLNTLGKAGTKIITNNVPTDHEYVTAKGFNSHDADNAGRQGALEAIAAVNGGDDGEILYVNTPDLGPGAAYGAEVWDKSIKADCPPCKTQTLDVKVGDVGKTLPSKLASYLQAHPKVKAVRVYYGDMLSGVPAALKGAGIEDVKLISSGGSRVNWQYIKDDQQLSDFYLYLNVYGYQLADIVARAVTDQKFEVPLLPTVWIKKGNVGDFDLAGTPPFGNDYKAQFQKLWDSAK